jgi:uncharacterized membrane protein YbaN (DUF454 family)
MTEARPHNNRWVRLTCLVAGFTALALGLLGVVLPVLPTTPFVLLAAACFAKSSTRFHDWLLSQRIAGPLIREWQEHRAMPRRAKRAAYLLMAASFGTSMLLIPALWHRILLASVASVLLYFLWRVPVREIDDADRRAPGATSS